MTAAAPPSRVLSIDAYRGFVMFLMLAEALHLGSIAAQFPSSPFWREVKFHTSHVDWAGCSLHDTIQPGFSFLVGVALPFSLAVRRAVGQSMAWATFHAIVRALVLIGLGVFLRSMGRTQTYFGFEDTLSQIGLGYVFLFGLGLLAPRWHWGALAAILVGYWAAFVLYQQPWEAGFTLADAWIKNSNLAWAFDTWFLNLFPREQVFTNNSGGYATLSFIPTLGTMILGLIAGTWMRQTELSIWQRSGQLLLAGAVCIALAQLAETLGICPIVKRIWTPAWTLYSGGICLLTLALLHLVIEGTGFWHWSFPLLVIGANSIFIYTVPKMCSHFRDRRGDGVVESSLKTHFGQDLFTDSSSWLAELIEEQLGRSVNPAALVPSVQGALVLLVFWLLLLWMYRQKLFVKI